MEGLHQYGALQFQFLGLLPQFLHWARCRWQLLWRITNENTFPHWTRYKINGNQCGRFSINISSGIEQVRLRDSPESEQWHNITAKIWLQDNCTGRDKRNDNQYMENCYFSSGTEEDKSEWYSAWRINISILETDTIKPNRNQMQYGWLPVQFCHWTMTTSEVDDLSVL